MRRTCFSSWLCIAFLGFAASALAAAQDSAPAEEKSPEVEAADIEVASPMVLDVALPARFGSISPRPGTAYQKEFTEIRRFLCDKTRVETLKVSRTTDKKGRAVITFEPTLLYRRDFRLKVEVIAGSETLLVKEIPFAAQRAAPGGGFAVALAPALVGLGASYSITPMVKLTIEEEKWKAAFSGDSAPIVRLTVTAKKPKKKRGDSSDSPQREPLP
jgi:hypothetical protein